MKLTFVILAFVLNFRPAPGQFVNILPSVGTDETAEAAAERVLSHDGLVSLGAWGGEIVFGLDSSLVNDHDYNFTIFGNAFIGAAEPGIVYVSADENHNGIADDTWYELAGSESASTRRNLSVTYYRPASDSADIRYVCSDGTSGYVRHNEYHSQSYYPSWMDSDSLVFHGSMLPCNAVDVSGNNTRIDLQNYDWGYADNQPNSDSHACSFKIDWAVDSLGNPVSLDYIDFVRVQTGVLFTEGGSIGEISTEVSGFSLFSELRDALGQTAADDSSVAVLDGKILFSSATDSPCRIFSVSGALICVIPSGVTEFSIPSLPSGIYLLHWGNRCYRFHTGKL